MPLSEEQIEKLLAPKLRAAANKNPTGSVKRWEPRPQIGPIRRYEKEERCVLSRVGTLDKETRMCGAPTYYKFQGVSTCTLHILHLANELLVEKGVIH